MKQILFGALIVMSFIACNDNPDNTTNSGDTTADSAYKSPTATDTGTGVGQIDSTNMKSGAGQGTGSGSQASQDTGTRRL